MDQQEKLSAMRERRDKKVRPHLIQYAPVWLIDEEVDLNDDALTFTTVFLHPHYGWVSRRYRHDSFNDVLYYLGQVMISEEKALELEDQSPYILAETISSINSYGG